jgi:preprotein translocase subunit SecD
MNVRKAFWGIMILAVVAMIIDLPRIPVKFELGSWKVDTVVEAPTLDLTALGIPVRRELEIKQGLDLQGGTQVVLRLDMSDVPANERSTAAASAVSVLENRVNYTGATEAVVQPALAGSEYRVLVELPGVQNTEQAVALIGQTAQLEFRELLNPADAASGFITMENTKATGLNGEDLESAVVDATTNPLAPQIAITFTSEGSAKFAELTSRLMGQPLPIFLDDVLLTAPAVQNVISNGQAVINGSFTVESARQLALQLSAGALPVPIEVVEQRTIGATLGQDSVERSLIAGGIGLLLVILFMALNYGKLGWVANAALVLYTLFTIAMIKWIPITLTLAGIAGLVLSIGMAVDANILIFERLREELRRGSKMRVALEIGFNRAWPSIRDSNIATMITCLILYTFGTGTVRGFALTLGLGVMISMFTAVFVTRTFMRMMYGGWQTTPARKAPNTTLARYRSAVTQPRTEGHA